MRRVTADANAISCRSNHGQLRHVECSIYSNSFESFPSAHISAKPAYTFLTFTRRHHGMPSSAFWHLPYFISCITNIVFSRPRRPQSLTPKSVSLSPSSTSSPAPLKTVHSPPKTPTTSRLPKTVSLKPSTSTPPIKPL